MPNAAPYMSPWPTHSLWQAANQTIAFTIRQHADAMRPLVDLACRIHERIHALDAYMDDMCHRTCPQCRNICCRHAFAYFDFKDLLCLHLGQGRLPGCQTLAKARQTCCYLKADGCRLPRTERPFICTWYLCPDQSARLEQMAPSAMRFMLNSRKALKTGREQLETEYVYVTTGFGLGG